MGDARPQRPQGLASEGTRWNRRANWPNTATATPKVECVSYVGSEMHSPEPHENAPQILTTVLGTRLLLAVFSIRTEGTPQKAPVRFVESLRLAANMAAI